ncbi:MAG: DUF1501 domain-containing protein [Piscinibacter sp.]|nr:DUF1501 domain-containing protein [Piscinibacter sp.]
MRTPIDADRRRLLRATLLAGAAGPLATLSLAAPTVPGGPRFVLVLLRGGLDGLYAVPSLGDPAFAEARGVLGRYASAPLPLADGFALHPNLAGLHAMFGRGELGIVHAVGLPYQERSHFDAQNILESGGTRPFQVTTGWLGRALAAGPGKGLALATTVPLVLRGGAAVDTWAPSALPDPSADLVDRLERLYTSDPALAGALARAKALHFDPAMMAEVNAAPAGMAGAPRQGAFVVLAQRCAEFLGQPNGPHAAVLEMGGWDSHANEAAPQGPTANALRQLDAGLSTLREGLVQSGVWRETVVVVATEFGREVAVNGTQGTDHGSGGAAFVLGGAVRGGRVWTDWPGLARRDRFEGRDLRTTTDLRAVLKGLLADHLRVPARRLERDVFPGSEAVRPLAVLA